MNNHSPQALEYPIADTLPKVPLYFEKGPFQQPTKHKIYPHFHKLLHRIHTHFLPAIREVSEWKLNTCA